MTSRSKLMLQLCINDSRKEIYNKTDHTGTQEVQNEHEVKDLERDWLPHFPKFANTNDAKIIEHTEECNKKVELVKEWVKCSNFTGLFSPENGDNANNLEKIEHAELLPLKTQSNEEIQVYNEKRISNSFYTKTANSEFESSKELEILQNIVISTSNTDSDIISETVDCDDSRDKDFDIRDFTKSNTSISSDEINDLEMSCFEDVGLTGNQGRTFEVNTDNDEIFEPLSDQIKRRKASDKIVARCLFCQEDVLSNNFMRHLQRHHGSEKEVAEILQLPINCKERRRALILLRKNTNFDLYISGTMRPCRKLKQETVDMSDYYPCAFCKGLFRKKYLKRHARVCITKPKSFGQTRTRTDHISNSHTIVACTSDPTDTISKLNVKEQVFDKMKGDEISFVAKKDLLIAHIAESYLKKHKRERMVYACSNRMRELSRLLICYRNLTNGAEVSFKDLLHPKNFDTVLSAARSIVGYNPVKKTFKSPSLAMHLGTSLKLACDELTHLILKENIGFKCKTTDQISHWLKNVKNFKILVESRWNSELASLANKDLQEKRWNKPLLLPLVNDIKIFRDECLKTAENCTKIFNEGKDDVQTYKLLVNCSLALLILFNRRRIGDVQFLKIADYKVDQRSNLVDFEKALTETEKMLTTKYKRVVNSGKGSRAIVLLIPANLQNYIDLLLSNREKFISPENNYIFAIPGSKIPWGKGDIAIRSIASNINLQNPQTITSNKLRKHIATVMQILSLTKEEGKQFSQFMGHTEKTHQEFYELPVDIYQTAKVSKILLMIEKGIPVEHKGKSLADINFDVNLEYAEENDDDDNGAVLLNQNTHVNPEETFVSEIFSDNPAERQDHGKILSCDAREYDENEFPQENPAHITSRRVAVTKELTNLINNIDDHNGGDVLPDTLLRNTMPKNKSKTTITKRGWNAEEIAALEREFAPFLKKKKYPSTQEIKDFLKKTRINRSVPVIKSKLQHLFKRTNTI